MNYLKRKLTDDQFESIIVQPLKEIMSSPWSGFYLYLEPEDENPEFIRVPPGSVTQVMRVFQSRDGFHRVNFFERPLSRDFWVRDFDLRYRGYLGTILAGIFMGGYYLAKNWFNRRSTK